MPSALTASCATTFAIAISFRRVSSLPQDRTTADIGRRKVALHNRFLNCQRLDVLRPQLEGLSHFLHVTMPLIYSGHTAEGPTAVVQCQLYNMWSNPEPLQSACEAAAKIVQRPPPDRWGDLSLRATMVTKRSVRAVEHKLAIARQGVKNPGRLP
jgi:hypothetical protein